MAMSKKVNLFIDNYCKIYKIIGSWFFDDLIKQ